MLKNKFCDNLHYIYTFYSCVRSHRFFKKNILYLLHLKKIYKKNTKKSIQTYDSHNSHKNGF